jgi:hypothetical protein
MFPQEPFLRNTGIWSHLFFINSNFLAFFSFLIRASSFEALDLFLNLLEKTILTGLREEVYFAPSLELLCSRTLLFKSVVIPVYKVLSAHKSM